MLKVKVLIIIVSVLNFFWIKSFLFSSSYWRLHFVHFRNHFYIYYIAIRYLRSNYYAVTLHLVMVISIHFLGYLTASFMISGSLSLFLALTTINDFFLYFYLAVKNILMQINLECFQSNCTLFSIVLFVAFKLSNKFFVCVEFV